MKIRGYDLGTPEGRLQAIEAVGVEQYNEMIREMNRRNIVETVNGVEIRAISTRFGLLFMVGDRGHPSLEYARAMARGKI